MIDPQKLAALLMRQIPPDDAEVVERGNFVPLGTYRTPDGKEMTTLAFPQPMREGLDAMAYALGYKQDQAAPAGYVTHDALNRGGMGLAESAIVGSVAAGAPRNALRAGMAAAKKSGQEKAAEVAEIVKSISTAKGTPTPDLDPSVAARALRAMDMGFENEAHYRGMMGAYDPREAKRTPQWFSNNPEVASSYGNSGIHPGGNVMPAYIRPGRMVEIDAGGRQWNELELSLLPDDIKRRVLDNRPAHWGVPQYTSTNDIVNALAGRIRPDSVFEKFVPDMWRVAGVPPDTIRFKNILDHALEDEVPSDVTVVLNPAHIRSTQAMFDPRRINEPDILAANPLAGAVPLMWQDHEQQERDKMARFLASGGA